MVLSALFESVGQKIGVTFNSHQVKLAKLNIRSGHGGMFICAKLRQNLSDTGTL